MDTQLRDDIRFINKFLYAIQKHRIELGNWLDAKKRDGIEPSDRSKTLFDNLTDQEVQAKRMAKDIVSLSAVWEEFFLNINGVAEALATSLMAEIQDINRFKTPSSLWAYAGLTAEHVKASCSKGHKMLMSSDKHKTCPVFDNDKNDPCGGIVTIDERVNAVPKRVKGYHYLFNNKLKTTCWKISEQLVKQGDEHFKSIYRTAKKYYEIKASEAGLIVVPAEELRRMKDKSKYISKGHIESRARRKMVKHFLVYLWEAWRACEHLDVRTPYVVEKLGHQGYIQWAELKALLREGKKKVRKIKKENVQQAVI